MSKNRPLDGNGESIIKGIGERLKQQHDKSSKAKENNKNEDKQSKKKETENSEQKNQNDIDTNDDWNNGKDTYKTTYTVKPEMEDNYDRCRMKFRRELRTLLSKQDAIELGLLLLRKLDDNMFEEVRNNFSPEDDSIEALKSIIEKYY